KGPVVAEIRVLADSDPYAFTECRAPAEGAHGTRDGYLHLEEGTAVAELGVRGTWAGLTDRPRKTATQEEAALHCPTHKSSRRRRRARRRSAPGWTARCGSHPRRGRRNP